MPSVLLRRAERSEASLTSFGTAALGCLPEARKRRGTPRLAPRGDKKRGSGREPFSVVSSEARNLHTLSCPAPCSAKSSEASLTSFGTAAPGRPLGLRLGATKKGVRGDKKRGFGVTAGGLAQKTFLIQPQRAWRIWNIII